MTVLIGPAAGWVPFPAKPTYRGTDPFRESADDWQLPVGHYYDNQANIPLRVIHPISGDANTNNFARHKWAHSQFKYQIPISVQGGAWPYHYEIIGTAGVDYPADMAIGADDGDANYEELYWTPAAESQNTQWTILIRVTDQAGTQKDITWTLELDDTMFRIQNPAATGPYNGTWAEPYKLFSDWYTSTSKTDPVADKGKIFVYRAGTHVLAPTAGGTGDDVYRFFLNATSIHPIVHIGVPGESVTWDCSGAHTRWCESGTGSFDMFVAGIDCTGSPGALVTNVRIFDVVGSGHVTFYNMTFASITKGSASDSNEACMYLGDPGYAREDITVFNCSSSGLPTGGTQGVCLFDIYSSTYILQTKCTDTSGTSAGARWSWYKAGDRYYTVRDNTLMDAPDTTFAVFDLYNSESAGDDAGIFEFLYNNLKAPGGGTSRLVDINQRKYGGVESGWVFRNTLQGFSIVDLQVNDDPVYFFSNVLISTDPIDTSYTIPGGETNVYETSATGVVDANGDLESTYLTAEAMTRGTHGHERA